MQQLTSGAVSDFAARLLSDVEEGVVWVVTDDPIDVAHRVVRRFHMGRYEIPHDLPPVRVVHLESRSELFVLSQPDHIPVVLTSMHPRHMGEIRQEERDDWIVVSIEPETQEPLVVRRPQVVIVDQAWPMWKELAQVVAPSTRIYQTDRVRHAIRPGQTGLVQPPRT